MYYRIYASFTVYFIENCNICYTCKNVMEQEARNVNALVVKKNYPHRGHMVSAAAMWPFTRPSLPLFSPSLSPSLSRPRDCPLTSSSAIAAHTDEQTALIQELLSLTQREHQYSITSSLRLSNDRHVFILMRMLLPQWCWGQKSNRPVWFGNIILWVSVPLRWRHSQKKQLLFAWIRGKNKYTLRNALEGLFQLISPSPRL